MFAKVNDTEIFFDVDGSGLDADVISLPEKPVMIMLNGGMGFDHGYLRLGFYDFAEHFQLIYTDMRGQGRSPEVKLTSINFDQMADDVDQLMKGLGIPSAIIFGHASGGFVAQSLAVRHPERVKAMILVSSSMGLTVLPREGDDLSRSPSLKDLAPEELLPMAHNFFFNPGSISLEEFNDYALRVGPYYLAPENREQFQHILGYTMRNIDLINYFRHLVPFYNSAEKVSLIKAPTLICSGFYDWPCPPFSSRMLADKIQGASLVEFEHSGHFLFIEEHDKFKELVMRFIDGLSEKQS